MPDRQLVDPLSRSRQHGTLLKAVQQLIRLTGGAPGKNPVILRQPSGRSWTRVAYSLNKGSPELSIPSLTNFLPSLEITSTIPACPRLRLTVTRRIEGREPPVSVVQGNLLNINITGASDLCLCPVTQLKVRRYAVKGGALEGRLQNLVTAGVKVLLKTVVRPQSRLALEQCIRAGNSLGRQALYGLNRLFTTIKLMYRKTTICGISRISSIGAKKSNVTV